MSCFSVDGHILEFKAFWHFGCTAVNIPLHRLFQQYSVCSSDPWGSLARGLWVTDCFVITLRHLPFSLCWHWHWWWESNRWVNCGHLSTNRGSVASVYFPPGTGKHASVTEECSWWSSKTCQYLILSICSGLFNDRCDEMGSTCKAFPLTKSVMIVVRKSTCGIV